MRHLGIASGLALAIFCATPTLAQRVMLVHLPSTPAVGASQQAEAVTALGEYLSARLEGGDPTGHAAPPNQIETKIFRRWRDARDYLDQQADNVALLLSDAAFLFDDHDGLQPTYRFIRQGRGTYRRLLVVDAANPIEKLVDVRDRSMAFVEAAGAGEADYMRSSVFGGELDPVTWFSQLEPTTDDFAATASVLYGETDAALVAEFNPLLTRHLDKELRTLFESPEISLPVLSLRKSSFSSDELATLERSLANLASEPLGKSVLAGLGFERFEKISSQDLSPAAQELEKAFEIAAPSAGTVTFEPLPPVAPTELTYGLTIELPEIPIPVEDEKESP